MTNAVIPLSRGLFATVDERDVEWLSAIRWFARPSSAKHHKCFYAVCHPKGRSNVITSMHRMIMGAGRGQIVDHIDRETLNNVRSNLRLVTSAQNASNRRGWGGTGITGVCWDKSSGTFKAYIDLNYKRYRLGQFADIEDAITARDKASHEMHGEYGVRSTDDPLLIAAAKELRSSYVAVKSARVAAIRKARIDRTRTIISMYRAGKKQKDIALHFGVAPQAISLVICQEKVGTSC